jgi:hypothetical protein
LTTTVGASSCDSQGSRQVKPVESIGASLCTHSRHEPFAPQSNLASMCRTPRPAEGADVRDRRQPYCVALEVAEVRPKPTVVGQTQQRPSLVISFASLNTQPLSVSLSGYTPCITASRWA